MTDDTTLGSRVKSLRKAKGFSQTALARIVGIKQPSLSQIEANAVKDPSSAIISRLAQALGTTSEYLLHKRGPVTRDHGSDKVEAEIKGIVESLAEDEQKALLSFLRVMHSKSR